MPINQYGWSNLEELGRRNWKCGYCDLYVANDRGYAPIAGRTFARPCPECGGLTTFFDDNDSLYLPTPTVGLPIKASSIDLGVLKLYEEARKAAQAGAYTASVMASRKILMNLAVSEGADPNESFQYYVDYIEKEGLVSKKAKDFVDYIRKLGNEATHEIHSMGQADAEKALAFVYSLLHHNYVTPELL